MPFGSKTHKTSWLVLALSLLLVPSVLAATIDEQLLASTKDEFNQLWHSAAETTRKRATLEETLAQFDSKVASAKQDLAKASEQRKVVREKMTEHRAFIEALQQQLLAAQSAKAFYDAVALSQRDEFAAFLRYATSRNIALAESGPVAGGDILKQVLRGSLGESVDDALAVEAVIKARRQFLGQARVLVSESDRVEDRLMEVALDYEAELKLLEKEHKSIASLVDEKSAFIDNSWMEKKLTEQELASVASEAAEASARVAELQENLVRINEELKQSMQKKYNDELVTAQAALKDLTDKRDALVRRDDALKLLIDNELRTFQTAINAKNSDAKLYKRLEEKKLELQNKEAEVAAMPTGSGSDAQAVARGEANMEIAVLKQIIEQLQDGIPLPEAEAYVYAKNQATQAKADRIAIATQIAALGPDVAKANKTVSDLVAKIADIEKQYALSDLPPLFQWPVSGVVTAGFHDEAYEGVFHVPHQGMDIAVPQATPVRSISDGVVFAYKDGGATGFSYILIGHRNGYASLYGHVSSSFVKKGDIVTAGQMIGLSGGTPGTHGAGYQTTGAHLHLEVSKDGVRINPMTILK